VFAALLMSLLLSAVTRRIVEIGNDLLLQML
jgi:hypothetical protein